MMFTISNTVIDVQVAMIGFPPIEAREDSLTALGRADLFGTGVNPQQMERMAELEVRWPTSRTIS